MITQTNTDPNAAQWLSQGDRALQALLSHCQIESTCQNQTLRIICPDKLFEGLLEYSRQINWTAGRSLIREVEFYRQTRDGVLHELDVSPDALSIQAAQIDPLGLMMAKRIGVNFDRAIAIVEMGSNRPIFATDGVIAQSKAGDIGNWLDKPDMSVYHYPDQLRRLEAAAAKGISYEFEWRAKAFDFSDIHIAANVYMGKIGKTPVRICENLHWAHC